MLLSVPDEGPAVDLASDALLHHISPVELQARVRSLHSSCCELRRRDEAHAEELEGHRREQQPVGRQKGGGKRVKSDGDVSVEF